jgi:cysteine-rich repeat protein
MVGCYRGFVNSRSYALWVVSATLALSCSPPPHAIIEVQDPLGLAAAADGVRLNEGTRVDLAGNDFPLRVTVTTDAPEVDRRVEVEALAGGAVVARGYATATFTSEETNTFAAVLGSPCDRSANGAPCQLADNSGPGLCLDGRCGPSFCSDGFLDEAAGEECDDGNADPEDGCLPNCVLNVCGDGFVNPEAEACDDGNDLDGDACLSDCVEARCGDGVVHVGVEDCDDGDEDETDACPSTCEDARCGDGFVRAGVEACDDGNDDNSDGCLSACTVARCGDGFVRLGFEDCDDGDEDDGDDCPSTCEDARCGDGFVQAGVEECDDGNNTDADDCLGVCVLNVCGDGIVNAQAGDDCDDGNTVDRDGCSSSCSFTIWEADLGGAPGANTIVQADEVNNFLTVLNGTIPTNLDVIAVTTAAGELVTLRAEDGSEIFRYDAGAPIIGGLSGDRGSFTFLSEDGALHYVQPDGSATPTTLPGGVTPVSAYATGVLLTTEGERLDGTVLGDDLVLYRVRTPGVDTCPGPAPCPEPLFDLSTLVPAPVPCPDLACTPSVQLPIAHIPAVGELIIAKPDCGEAVRYPLDDPDDYVVGHVAFLGDRDQDYDADDLLFGVTASGALYRFDLFLAFDAPNSVCGIDPISTTPQRLGQTLPGLFDEPVLAPVGGVTVILPDLGGVLHKRVGDDLRDDTFNPLWSLPDVTLSHTPALDAEGFLYFADSTPQLNKVHLISGAAATPHPLPAGVSTSPLVGNGAVYVLLDDGRVQALERGGSRMPRYAAWHRHGGSADGIAAAACGLVGSSPLLALAALLLLLRRRPR